MKTKRRVEWAGQTYAVKSDSIEIPDFTTMDRLDTLMWLNKNTYKRGHSTHKANPIQGFARAIAVKLRSERCQQTNRLESEREVSL